MYTKRKREIKRQKRETAAERHRERDRETKTERDRVRNAEIHEGLLTFNHYMQFSCKDSFMNFSLIHIYMYIYTHTYI